MNLTSLVAFRANEAGSDCLAVFGGSFEGGMRTQQKPEEFARLVCILAALAPFKSALEIGIAAGGAVRLVREFVKIEHTTVIDDGKHPGFHIWPEVKNTAARSMNLSATVIHPKRLHF